MPFTLSHAAASLPFRRFKPVWPALVVGTFAPDLQYFIQLSDENRSGHHYPDVLLFTLPVAALALWLFECVVKAPAIGLLPSGWERRLQDKIAPLSFKGWRQVGRIVFWIAVGTATHLVWDQFTHSYSRMSVWWPLLKQNIVLPWSQDRFSTVAGMLQDMSTVLGLFALCLWCAAWYRHTPPAPKILTPSLPPLAKLCIVVIIALVAVAAGYLLAYFNLADHVGPMSDSTRGAIVFITVTQMLCIEMLIYGTAMTLRNRSQQAAASEINNPAHQI